MKKLITIIILLIAVQVSAQNVTKKYIRITKMDFNNPTYCFEIDNKVLYTTPIKNVYLMRNVGDDIDTTHLRYEGKLNLKSQGFKEQTDTLEVQQELQNVQKLYKETYEQKVKALETTDADLIRLQGIIIYLNSKLEALRKQK